MALGPSALLADDYTYPYLIITDAAGAQTTLSVASLEITFVDGQLVATNGDGTTKLTLADLASMQFSTTGAATPVEPDRVERAAVPGKAVKAYTVSGIFVGQFESVKKAEAVLPKGLYVVSSGSKNIKLNIR